MYYIYYIYYIYHFFRNRWDGTLGGAFSCRELIISCYCMFVKPPHVSYYNSSRLLYSLFYNDLLYLSHLLYLLYSFIHYGILLFPFLLRHDPFPGAPRTPINCCNRVPYCKSLRLSSLCRHPLRPADPIYHLSY